MNEHDQADRLYDLLPVVHRQRDAEQGYPLRALLRVMAEQVNVVEDDIAQLYENWFVETAQDWVVPYIGDLIGYRPVHEAGEPGGVTTEQGRQRNKILIPRREVANTIRYRRRKGTLALLELLARDVAGWPARAVEFYRLLGWTQHLDHQRLGRGRTVDLRRGDALDRIDGPFDELAHGVDVRRVNSHRGRGRYNIPSVGLFVWRLRSYSVSRTPAYCQEGISPHCFTFSALGNDAPLYVRPRPEASEETIAGELNLPVPIRRRAMEARLTDYYGPGKSLEIYQGSARTPIPMGQIVVADLGDWQYRPRTGTVAVDPVLGRLAFPPRALPKQGVWVSYHYGFPADMGGGEYSRALSQPAGAAVYRVGSGQPFATIRAALARWTEEAPAAAVVEITDSGVYVEQINVELAEGQRLQLRAASGVRPILRLLDWQTDRPDNLAVHGQAGSRFTLDGLLVTGRGMQVEGGLARLTIRHCTLLPGWAIDSDCEPLRPAEPSLELIDTQARVTIDHSIVGSIQVNLDEVEADPLAIEIRDSVVDATGPEREAVGAPSWPLAHAALTVQRSTIFGLVQTHAIDLGENSLFMGRVKVARSQRGCLRSCYVPPGSRTPRRYNCQPDLVEKPIREAFRQGDISAGERDRALAREQLRVRPRFNSVRYGTPTYCQLAAGCAPEIVRGADDESEMGVFHDLFQPQREANLRARLEEYTPAGMDAGIIFAS